MKTNYYFFLNRKNVLDGFRESINGQFFVDKSVLIEVLNRKISTKEKWICVSRPRRQFFITTAPFSEYKMRIAFSLYLFLMSYL